MQIIWAFIFLCVSISSALAMGWYSSSCCNDRDCRPAEPNEVTLGAEGWDTPYGIVKFDSERIQESQDLQFHICLAPNPQEETIEIRCLYVPPVA